MSIFGLRGCGNTELIRTLFCAEQFDEGEIIVGHGERLIARGKPVDAMEKGIFFLPSDRKEEGLILDLSVKENITLPSLPYLSKLGFIDSRSEKSLADDFIKTLGIKTPSPNTMVKTLSGGNQQKVVMARATARRARILLFCEPTAGIDIATKIEIYNLINRLVEEGCLVIIVSSELPEVLGISDRILVMHKGKIAKEYQRDNFDQEDILQVAFGESDPRTFN